jgi:putative salt-induced outer membrane protein YdiY
MADNRNAADGPSGTYTANGRCGEKSSTEQETDMKRLAKYFKILELMLVLLPATASADEVYLKNGNHLSGIILSLNEGKLVLETDFAGQLSIKWNHVERIASEVAVTVVLSDGSTREGVIRSAEATTHLLLINEPTTEATTLPVSEITSINPPLEPSTKLSGRIQVGLNKASGNIDTQSAYTDAELIYRAAENRLTLFGTYNRASEDNRKIEDNARAYLKHDYFLTKKLYWYMNGEMERDEFKEINLRTTIGPGVGYQFFEDEFMNFSVETGPSYVKTDYNKSADEDSISGRWALFFDRFFFENLFQYYFSNEGYISVSDTSNIFMVTKTGLRFPLHLGLFMNAGFEWDWDNTPADDADKSDYRYILSVGYGF